MRINKLSWVLGVLFMLRGREWPGPEVHNLYVKQQQEVQEAWNKLHPRRSGLFNPNAVVMTSEELFFSNQQSDLFRTIYEVLSEY
jgi:hypothetical protein